MEQSFGQAAGRSGQWVMHPVITGAEIGFTGGVDVTVTPAAGATIVTDPASPLEVTVLSGARATAAFTVTSAN